MEQFTNCYLPDMPSSRRETGEGDAFDVVFVCTGNRVRSPLAEALLARMKIDRVRVSSFGTQNVGSQPALPDAIAVGAALGVDLTAHRTRVLDPTAMARADLVIGFEAFHVSSAVVDGRAARERTFMIRELDALLDPAPRVEVNDGVARARSIVELAQSRRIDRPRGSTVLPVADPLGQSREVYQQIAGEIDTLVRRLAATLFAVPAVRHVV